MWYQAGADLVVVEVVAFKGPAGWLISGASCAATCKYVPELPPPCPGWLRACPEGLRSRQGEEASDRGA